MELIKFVMVLILTDVICATTHQSLPCGPSVLSTLDGSIKSPNYPLPYPNYTNCIWYIKLPPSTVLTIRVIEIDIEEDDNCDDSPCCVHNWLSLPNEGGRGVQQLCGHKLLVNPISVSQDSTKIKFHSSKVVKGGRGFHLTYSTEAKVESLPCPAGETRCLSGDGCYKEHQRCDSTLDCSDFSDEIDCNSLCGEGQVICSSADGSCFSPRSERCNGKLECPFGEDEVGCSKGCPADKLGCANGEGCYSPSQRCNSIQNCRDDSDETNCPPCNAMSNKFQCDNGRCISDQLWCNDVNDCGDHSDEHSCLKNSVVTAAIMGSLICGLLLIVAVGCVCRLYGLRITTTRHNYQLDHEQAQRRQAVLHPDEEFFHREPPPAYSVSDSQPLQRMPPLGSAARVFTAATSDHHTPNSRHQSRSRSSRRHLSSRRRSQRSATRNTSPSDSTISGIARARSRLHSVPHVQAFVPASTTDVHETSLEARQESLRTANKDKTGRAVDESTPSSHGGSEEHRQEEEIINISPLSSSTSSSTESPSRGSVTSSTSAISNLSGNEDTQLLLA